MRARFSAIQQEIRLSTKLPRLEPRLILNSSLLGRRCRRGRVSIHSHDRSDETLACAAGSIMAGVYLTRQARFCAIAQVSTELSNMVKETPRQVISANIIDKANVLLELIQIARSFSLKV